MNEQMNQLISENESSVSKYIFVYILLPIVLMSTRPTDSYQVMYNNGVVFYTPVSSVLQDILAPQRKKHFTHDKWNVNILFEKVCAFVEETLGIGMQYSFIIYDKIR